MSSIYKNIHIFILSLLIVIILAKAECPNDKSHLAPVRLKNDLLCGYERSLRPVVNHQNSTKVIIRMVMKYFRFDPHESIFSIDSWIALFWKDEHLKWNPDDYESLKLIHLTSNDIWMPDISVYNRHDQSGDPSAISAATCIVYNTGQVVCVPPTRQNSLCVADLRRYPFDEQNCTVRFGSWVHTGEEIDFKLAQPPVTTDDLIPNGEWTLIETSVIKHSGKYQCCPNNTYPSLNFSFKIKRLGAAHAASIILPAISLTMLTLITLWIDPDKHERLYLSSVNLICHFLFSQYISWMIPMHGENVPLIIQFTRDSLLLSSFTIILAVTLKNLLENKNQSPTWISRLVGCIVAYRPGQVVFLNNYSINGISNLKCEEDGETIIENVAKSNNNNNNKDLIIFSKILDRLWFLCYLIIYFYMFIAFMP